MHFFKKGTENLLVLVIHLTPAPSATNSPSGDEEWEDRISEEMLRVVREARRRRGALTERSPLMASASITSYWSQATTSGLPSDVRGSDLWTSGRPGKNEIWSSITYALTVGKRKYVKIYLLETSAEDKCRFVGPTFHTSQEAHHFCTKSRLAWPGDKRPLDLKKVRSEGLLKAWSQVWSAKVEACVRTSAESVERFVENFNITSTNLHIRVPKTFVDQLMTKNHREEISTDNPKYETTGRGYFFPEQPPEDSDGSDMPDTPVHRRVFAFTSIVVSAQDHEVLKYGFVRSRIKGDQYFVAATPDYNDVDELKAYFSEDPNAYPAFDFDAKWMLLDTVHDSQ